MAFLFFYNMKVCCVFPSESPHRGDSNEYTQHTMINVRKKISLIIQNKSNIQLYDF